MGNFIGIAQDMNLINEFEKYAFKIISTSPRDNELGINLTADTPFR